ncbi:dephospho-CoA kinase [Thalassotalea euphylliae]|uniref:Dephospho-CoA kinase n=1 Tax=Thalassotalea euphylliae TaxID=1655234 RepID=A0A3E0UHR7_9GAMM|nr:dephospho-CoA kinase [Thalassotalea euphylliae]REL36591.1 dephospho-CoA kinase [Thalassotalea euphylliae]
MIIGLTGGIGSGKTTVANYFANLGIDIIDADIVAREVVEPGTIGLTKITDHFGEQVLKTDGSLNREKLRQIVFTDSNAKQWLNQLLHPMIRTEIFTQLSKAKSPYKLLVAPLLIENGLDAQVDNVLVVDITEEQQLERTLKRDNSTPEVINNIISAQVSREERLAKADDVIDNSSANLADVEQQVHNLHKKYLSLAAS